MSEEQQVESQHGGEVEHQDGESVIILFIITCLIVSVISKEINHRIGFPYTPLLIIIGLVIGYQGFLGQISTSVELIMEIHPHSILTIFLPILIFESSYNARIPNLSTNYLQVLTLIIPAVILTALMIGFTLKFIIGYEDDDLLMWDALTLGAILAATDPVAVVALLKDLGAPIHINTIIEMESLFNDGTAMVFFTIFYEFSIGGSKTIGESIVLFLRLALGGPALGVAFGLGASLLLNFLEKGQTLFLHVILLSCYSVFYVGEQICGVSGLLAIVACGLTLNKYMKNMMTVQQVHHSEEIITYIQLINESLLFFFAGVIIGFELDDQFRTTIFGADWGYMIVLYIFVVIIRFLSISVLYPILFYSGESFNCKELLLSVWGGLRGALGIALALVVYTDGEEMTERSRTLILFHTCGVAALTLIINGLTAQGLVEEIKIIENLSVRKYFKSLFMKQVKKVGIETLEQLRQDTSYSMTLWRGVDDIIQLDQIDDERKHIKMMKSNIIMKYKQKVRDQNAQRRYQILRHMTKFIGDAQHHNYFYNNAFGIAEEAIMQCCEKPHMPINIWRRCERSLGGLQLINKYMPYKCIAALGVIGIPFEFIFYSYLNQSFRVIDILHKVLTEAMKLERHYEDKNRNQQSMMPELQKELNFVEDNLNLLKQQFAEPLQKLSQQHAAAEVVKYQAHFIDTTMGSLIPDKEGTEIRDGLLSQYISVNALLVTRSLRSGKEVILHTTFKELLDNYQIQEISHNQEVKFYKAGTEIVSKDDPSMCVIISGQVEERLYVSDNEFKSIVFAAGNAVGLANVIDKNLNIAIVAKTPVEAIKVNIHLDINEQFAQFCFKRTLPEFMKLYCANYSIQNMGTAELVQISNDAEIHINSSRVLATFGAFVFEGQYIKTDTRTIYNQWEFIPPSSIMLETKSNKSVIATFKYKIIQENQQQFSQHVVISQHKVYPEDDMDEKQQLNEQQHIELKED